MNPFTESSSNWTESRPRIAFWLIAYMAVVYGCALVVLRAVV